MSSSITKTFVTSDIHFNHRQILQYCPHRRLGKEMPTDFDAVTEMVSIMNEKIISNWNSVVGTEDTVWILGDVAMGQIKFAPELIRRLNGKKHLVKGNHDKTLAKLIVNENLNLFESVQDYKELHYSYEGKKRMICMSHFPMSHWDSMNQGTIMLHGHTHGSPTGLTGRITDVGMDTNDLFPYSMDGVVKKMLAIDIIRDHH